MSSNRRLRRRELSGGLENLEGRELMTGGGIYGPDGKYINKFDYRKLLAKRDTPPAPPSQRQVVLELPDRFGTNAKAVITLYGPGSLQTPKIDSNGFPVVDSEGNTVYDESKSTHIDPNTGQISILFDGTTSESQIVGMVYGTRQRPEIEEIRDVDATQYNTTGVGTNQMGYVNLNRFDLARGGRINFTAGVQRIFLNEIRHGTQIDVAALKTPPTTSPQNPGGLGSDTVTSSSGSTAVTGGGTTTTTTTTVNGITVITTLPTTDQLTISNGELTGVGGLIVPGAIPSTARNTRVEVQGVELIFKKVDGHQVGSPTSDDNLGRLGTEQIAGLNDNGQATDNVRLTFYDIVRDPDTFAITSAVRDTEGINDIVVKPPDIAGISQNAAITPLGTGLAEYQTVITMPPVTGTPVRANVQVVAVGYSLVDNNGKRRYFVNAYNVLTRTSGNSNTDPEWYFEVVDPKTGEPFPFDGLGGSSGDLYVTRSGDAITGDTGLTQGLNVDQSFDTKVSVPLGSQFDYPSSFNSKGGTTGVAGVSFIYTAGLSYFTAWNPENPDPQLGIMKIAVSATNQLSVSSTTRTGGAVAWDSNVEYVMGSVDQNVILIDPTAKKTESAVNQDGVTVTKSYYAANMYDSNSLGSKGSFKLYVDANQTIGGLSESFFPQALGAAVIDVRGNLKTFSATDVENMVLNVNGIASYVRANDARNSTIIGHPILHLAVSRKPNSNVTILSSSRPTDETPGGRSRPGTRGGVRVIKNLPIIGPVVNPVQGSST